MDYRANSREFYIYELYRKYEVKKLTLDSKYRLFEDWNIESKSLFIESILMGLRTPTIFLKMHQNTDMEVCDGHRRLAALFDFMEGKFELKGLEVLSVFNGKRFADFEGDLGIYRTQIEDSCLNVTMFMPPTSDEIIFNILERVNCRL